MKDKVWALNTIFSLPDAGGVQVCPHPEEGAEGQAGHDAAIRPEAAQSADQIPGTPVEEEQHEDYVCHLPEGATSAQRWLGLRKWWVEPQTIDFL